MTERHVFCGPVFLGRDLKYVDEGFVVVEDGKIADCGEGTVDGGLKRSVVPAFINAHTHVGDYFLREKFFEMDLVNVCGKDGIKEKYLKTASDEVIVSGMRTAIAEMVRTGTCAFADFREGGVKGINLLKMACTEFSNVRVNIFGRPEYPGEEFLLQCDGYGARSVRAEKRDDSYGKLLGIHVCETKSGELEAALGFKPDFLVHMNSASVDEIRRAGSLRIPIVVCPRSNGYFRLKMPDIALMIDEGVLVCLGTDNAMSNSASMMSEMEYAFRMLIGRVDAREILKMATVNPAKVFGWNSGFIEKGADANLVLFDEEFLKTDDPYATAVLRMAAQRFEVMIGGKYVYHC
ncbi:MAG: amidohydrolase family protein [archaeon]